ncbi:hypothetical protein Q5M85_08255 [Paraclostridium bifermentans]|nr:hypothetical protein [Paraclostridium bifermentans]
MYYLGTVNEVTLYTKSNEKEANDILNNCENIIKDIDNKMNHLHYLVTFTKLMKMLVSLILKYHQILLKL